MATWYKATVTKSQILAGQQSKTMREFEAIFMALLAPKDMAMFGGNNPISENQQFFFAIPENTEMVTKLFLSKNAAEQCPRPKESECSLLVGNADSFELLR